MRRFFFAGVILACVTAVGLAHGQQDPNSLTSAQRGDQLLTSPNPGLPVPAGVGAAIITETPVGAALAPLGITVDTDAGLVYVAALFEGVAEFYDRDLTLGPLGTIPSPGGIDTQTGIAYNANTQTLFWIDATANTLFETDTAGVVLNAFGLVSPGGGLLGGMAFDALSGNLLMDDIVADQYFFADTTGAFTGEGFGNPDAQCGAGAFGNGVAADGSGNFHVPSGTLAEGETNRLSRVDATGTVFESAPFSALNGGPIPDTFINGVAYDTTGSGGGTGPVLYVAGNALATIYEVETFDNTDLCGFATISDITCTQPDPGSTDVLLTFTENDSYDTVTILRNGTAVGNAIVGDGTFTDVAAPQGAHRYTIEAAVGATSCAGDADCCVTVVGGCELVFANTGGAAPLGITVVEPADQIWVLGLFDGLIQQYERNGTFVNAIPSPGGANTETGIAYDPNTDTIFLVDATANVLNQIDNTGLLLNSFAFNSPGGGLIGGMDLNFAGDMLIIDDIVADTYYEMNFDGTAGAVSFPNPSDDPPGTGAFGNGIGTLPASAPNGAYDIPVGTIAQAGVVEIVTTDDAGNVLPGCSEPVGPGNFIDDTFVNGVVVTTLCPDGMTAGLVRYVVGNASNQIYANEVSCTPCNPVTDLTATQNGSDVDLTWTNNDTYSEHRILRDGALVETVAGGDTAYTDTAPGSGFFTYVVESDCASGGMSMSGEVSLLIVPAGTTDLVCKLDGGAVDGGGALTAALSAAGRTPFEVTGVPSSIPTSLDGVWVAAGMFPDNTALTQEEGTSLRDFAFSGNAGAPKALYVEGGDVWGFDAPTPLDEADHTVGLADGAGLCDAASVEGQDTGVGLDLTGTVPLVDPSDCAWIDHLDIDTAMGSGISFVNAGGALQNTGVAGDSEVSGLGGGAVYRSCTQSLELGSFGGNAQAVMDAYTDFFFGGGGGGDMIRGDANGDGGFNGLVDGLFALNFQFVPGSPVPPCLAQADANGDNGFNGLVDGLFMLNFQFVPGSPPIPAPYPDCGDGTATIDALGCDVPFCP